MSVRASAALVEPLRAAPDRSAVLLDVDGTLAPIVRHADAADVPTATRSVLAEVERRYAIVACISGRRAVDARRIVGIGSLLYVGNHGSEILRRGAATAETTPEVAAWEERVKAVVADVPGDDDLTRLGVVLEDKGPIQALHWRGAADPAAAGEAAAAVGRSAEAAGLRLHEGRMVLELRPPVAFDKGAAVRWLLGGGGFAAALYAGDDHTDVDAFEGLRELGREGAVAEPRCVAVADGEAPAEVAAAADLVVDGTAGVRDLLLELLRP